MLASGSQAPAQAFHGVSYEDENTEKDKHTDNTRKHRRRSLGLIESSFALRLAAAIVPNLRPIPAPFA